MQERRKNNSGIKAECTGTHVDAKGSERPGGKKGQPERQMPEPRKRMTQ